MKEVNKQPVGAMLDRYSRDSYGLEEILHELKKIEIKQIVLSMHESTNWTIVTVTLLAQTVQKISSQNAAPSEEMDACIKHDKERLKSACSARKEA